MFVRKEQVIIKPETVDKSPIGIRVPCRHKAEEKNSCCRRSGGIDISKMKMIPFRTMRAHVTAGNPM